jgi:hypothetical protein
MAYPSRLRFASVLLPLLSLPLTGCPDKKDDRDPQSIDEVLSRVVQAICKFEAACELTPDLATCLAVEVFDDAELAAVRSAIAAGRINYDPAKGGACVEWVERFYTASNCTQSSRASFLNSGSDACESLVTGTVAVGSPCLVQGECVSGGICQRTDPACTQQCCSGTCVARPAPVPVGGDCTTLQPNQSCATGSFCFAATSGGPPVCTIPSTVEGSACATIYACAGPLFCDRDTTTGMGMCRRAAASGASCIGGAISYASCDDIRDTCDEATGTCVRRTAVGGTCDPARYDCVGYAQCAGTTCVAGPRPGEACTPEGVPDCLGSYLCSAQTSTCELIPPDGSCG